jgi:uncharacterized integral membrane protein (TIGR00698 family)
MTAKCHPERSEGSSLINTKNIISYKMKKIFDIIPGLLLASLIAFISYFACYGLCAIMDMKNSPVSMVTFAIIIGMLLRNTIGVSKYFNNGINFSVRKLLRLGIILMGIRMSILDVAKVGLLSVIIVIVCISTGLIITTFITRKLGLSDRLGTLIAVGTGICGVSAIMATAPTINAKEEETAYAVGTITIFGLIALLVYPYLVHIVLGLSNMQAGIFLGTSIHDTSQVTGAGMMYNQLWLNENTATPTAMDIAVVTKLVRNTFIAVVIPLMAYIYSKKGNTTKSAKVNFLSYIPLFVIFFVLLALIRTAGDYLVINKEIFWNIDAWKDMQNFIKTWSEYFLVIAMAGAGLSIDIKRFGQLGYKPFLAGLISAVTVGFVSFILIKALMANL